MVGPAWPSAICWPLKHVQPSRAPAGNLNVSEVLAAHQTCELPLRSTQSGRAALQILFFGIFFPRTVDGTVDFELAFGFTDLKS
jgi:hypothetical protein